MYYNLTLKHVRFTRQNLSRLMMSHENQNFRKVVITHMTELIKANRDLFQSLIVDEELSSMNFLTIVHDSKTNGDSSSVVMPGMIMHMIIIITGRNSEKEYYEH